jgi:hypothetical protein
VYEHYYNTKLLQNQIPLFHITKYFIVSDTFASSLCLANHEYITQLLITKAEMLKEYFSVDIDSEGQLVALPQIIEGYIPQIDGLASFILRLATEVEWREEQECFETFSRELSEFYAIQPQTELQEMSDAEDEEENNDEEVVSHAADKKNAKVKQKENSR